MSLNKKLDQLYSSKFFSFYLLFCCFVPVNKSLLNRHLVNIYFLNLVCSYTGYRHFFGLPVRGQRTWSNSRTSFKNNLLLRNYKNIYINTYYGKQANIDFSSILNAEDLNFLWKTQWNWEWLKFKKVVLNELKKKPYKKLQISDLGIKKDNNDKLKKKVEFMGFEPGFSKIFFKRKKIY